MYVNIYLYHIYSETAGVHRPTDSHGLRIQAEPWVRMASIEGQTQWKGQSDEGEEEQ